MYRSAPLFSAEVQVRVVNLSKYDCILTERSAKIQKNIYIKKEKTGFSYCLLFFYSSKGLLLVLLFFIFLQIYYFLTTGDCKTTLFCIFFGPWGWKKRGCPVYKSVKVLKSQTENHVKFFIDCSQIGQLHMWRFQITPKIFVNFCRELCKLLQRSSSTSAEKF